MSSLHQDEEHDVVGQYRAHLGGGGQWRDDGGQWHDEVVDTGNLTAVEEGGDGEVSKGPPGQRTDEPTDQLDTSSPLPTPQPSTLSFY